MKEKIANIISLVFNAYLSFLVANLIIILSEKALIPNYAFIIFLYVFMRVVQLFIFKKFKLISDWDMTDRRERPLFNYSSLIPSTILIIIATTTKSDLFLSLTIINFCLDLIMGTVSIFWKVSGHMTCLTFLTVVSLFFYFSWPLVIFWLIIIPLVGWSRIVLHKHTLAQVIGGVVLGFVVPLLLL